MILISFLLYALGAILMLVHLQTLYADGAYKRVTGSSNISAGTFVIVALAWPFIVLGLVLWLGATKEGKAWQK